MIEYANDPSLYLYHYTSSEIARKILESGSIRLGRYRNTNDPKESKDWHFCIGIAENITPAIKYDNIYKRASIAGSLIV